MLEENEQEQDWEISGECELLWHWLCEYIESDLKTPRHLPTRMGTVYNNNRRFQKKKTAVTKRICFSQKYKKRPHTKRLGVRVPIRSPCGAGEGALKAHGKSLACLGQ